MNEKVEIPADVRRQQLEEFAKGSTNGPSNYASPSIAPMAGAPERVFGAQAVAVFRDEARILQKLTALGQAKGDDWFYRFPVKSGGATTYIEGASIKLANDVARIYGNCDVDVRMYDMGDSWVFYARFTEFETGYSLTRPFQQRKNQGSIRGDAGRALDIAFQIGTSKAIRNVVVNALQTFSDHAFDAARNSLVQRIGSDLAAWRARTVEGLGKIPVDLVRAERVIGKAAKDWLAPDVAMVIAMMKAIADGMASPDETFPVADKAVEETAATDTASTQTGESQSPGQQSASGQPASGATEDKPSPGATSAPGASTATTTETKTADSATARTEEPVDEKTWAAYADTTIKQLGSADEGTKWWKDGKALRNKCNVTEEVREEKKQKLDEKVAALGGAKKK